MVSCFSGFTTGIAGGLRAGTVVSCFSGFTTGIAGGLRSGTGCMQCGELL